MKRAIVIVIDSMGIGANCDCEKYGDSKTCNTIKNTAEAVGGLNIPNMEKMGIGNLEQIKGVKKVENAAAKCAILTPSSPGKDTTTGHWELMGLVLSEPFKTYPNGFDSKIIERFIQETGCGGVLGNYPASGTKIIEELNEEHQRTKFPIIYTSADSVFQIAVDINLISLETLYFWCQIARKILDEETLVSRVIARPYEIIDNKPKRISKYRHDYSLLPFSNTLLNEIETAGKKVYGIGKIEDIFVGSGVTEAKHTGSNQEGLELTLEAVKNSDASLIFTNLVDTDMLFGHRRDPIGYAKAIEEIDTYLPKIIENMNEEDLLIITADHGCDPTSPGSDHTRERVPLLIYNKKTQGQNLGVLDSFTYVCGVIRGWLGIF